MYFYKTTISLPYLSVLLSTQNRATPTARILVNFHVGIFFTKFVTKTCICLKLDLKKDSLLMKTQCRLGLYNGRRGY
jgi:hypothetical protein